MIASNSRSNIPAYVQTYYLKFSAQHSKHTIVLRGLAFGESTLIASQSLTGLNQQGDKKKRDLRPWVGMCSLKPTKQAREEKMVLSFLKILHLSIVINSSQGFGGEKRKQVCHQIGLQSLCPINSVLQEKLQPGPSVCLSMKFT